MPIYDSISYPVPVNVPFISSLIATQWDHSQQWTIPTYEIFTQSLNANQHRQYVIDLNDGQEYAFIRGHQIDGRCLFPVSGSLILVWKTFAKLHHYEDYRQLAVLFEQVQIHHATICTVTNKTHLYISILPNDGSFEIVDNKTVIVTGRISISERLMMQELNRQKSLDDEEDVTHILQHDEIYRHLSLRGYDYSESFRSIYRMNVDLNIGELIWRDEWISYLDAMLQIDVLPLQGLQIPIRIDSLRIHPQSHEQFISSQTSICSVYFDYCNDLCFSGAVELFGVHFAGISKNVKQQNAILESYEFVPWNNQQMVNELQSTLYLVLENILESTISICHIGSEELVDDIISFCLQQPPEKSVDYTIVSNSMIKNDTTQQLSVIKNLLLLKSPVDLMIVQQDKEIAIEWDQVFSACKSSGFLLLYMDMVEIAENHLSTANFTLIAQRLTLQLWRKTSEDIITDTIIDLDVPDYQWIDEIQTSLADLSAQRTWLVSNRSDSGILGFFNCLKREPGGQLLRCIQIQGEKSILDNHTMQDLQMRNLVVNVYQNDQWGSYVHLPLRISKEVAWIDVDNAHIDVLNRGDLSSLTWIQSSPITKINDANSDICLVHYASLNFRDIMLASGKLNPEAIPGYWKMQGCLLGLEFSGLDSEGQRIMGLLPAKGLATRITVDKRYTWCVPEHWTLEQASTIPVAYATAYYALIVRGHLKRGEKVLIHAGAGSVGTAALAIAYSYNCEVFVTVSSNDKRGYLKNLFPCLNDDHICNSRDTIFEQHIRTITQGKGVNIVLNSLAEDKLQASARLLAQHGRFLEIGKFDLSRNNSLGMGFFLKNTTFHGVLLDSLFEHANEDWLRVHACVEQGIRDGIVQPLNTTVFRTDEIEQAFRFMSTGKHMGKIVVKVFDESRPLIRALRKTWFYPNKVYVITGGLGGFGLELTEWLVERGARHVILCSRTDIRTGYQRRKLNYLERFFDATISIWKHNIINENECEILIKKLAGNIGGIFHLAAVLNDGLFENLTKEKFEQIVKVKYDGARNLDKFTRIHCQETLDYFVVFSSISCGRGNAGQTNYGYANATMERLCEQRRYEGLPALAIQWGALADVGMAMKKFGSNKIIVCGTLPQQVVSCLETLDYFLRQSINSAVVSSHGRIGKVQETSDTFPTTTANLVQTIANILGIADTSAMSSDSTLTDFGLDSLGSVEIKQLLEQKYSLSSISSKEVQQLTIQRLREIDSTFSSKIDNSRSSVMANQKI